MHRGTKAPPTNLHAHAPRAHAPRHTFEHKQRATLRVRQHTVAHTLEHKQRATLRVRQHTVAHSVLVCYTCYTCPPSPAGHHDMSSYLVASAPSYIETKLVAELPIPFPSRATHTRVTFQDACVAKCVRCKQGVVVAVAEVAAGTMGQTQNACGMMAAAAVAEAAVAEAVAAEAVAVAVAALLSSGSSAVAVAVAAAAGKRPCLACSLAMMGRRVHTQRMAEGEGRGMTRKRQQE